MIIQSVSTPDSPSQPSEQLIRELQQAMLLDPGLRRIVDKIGYPSPRVRPSGFATLLRIIVSQQLSTNVAAAIWARLEKLCRRQITCHKILKYDAGQLKQCGLSRQKVGYIHDLARMVAQKTINFKAIERLDTEQVIAELCTVRGVGQWSAEIYAMFALGHRDVFPAGDLALQVAVQRYECLSERPAAKQAEKLATKWSPHRSSVALLMWKYYGSATLD